MLFSVDEDGTLTYEIPKCKGIFASYIDDIDNSAVLQVLLRLKQIPIVNHFQ